MRPGNLQKWKISFLHDFLKSKFKAKFRSLKLTKKLMLKKIFTEFPGMIWKQNYAELCLWKANDRIFKGYHVYSPTGREKPRRPSLSLFVSFFPLDIRFLWKSLLCYHFSLISVLYNDSSMGHLWLLSKRKSPLCSSTVITYVYHIWTNECKQAQ